MAKITEALGDGEPMRHFASLALIPEMYSSLKVRSVAQSSSDLSIPRDIPHERLELVRIPFCFVTIRHVQAPNMKSNE